MSGKKTFRLVLKYLLIIQEMEVKNDAWNRKTKTRINPFNPLSYIVYVIALIIAFFCYGFNMGKEITTFNVFKWQ